MSTVRTSIEGRVGVAEIDRPPHNFFDIPMIQALAAAFEGWDGDPRVRAILLCATGKNVCAGADFSAPARDTIGFDQGGSQQGGFRQEGGPQGGSLYQQGVRLFRCRKPVIAAVQGGAIGGGLGLALVADFRVATPESRFSANFARLGFHPGFGLSVTLPRIVGEQKAALLFYTGRRIGGEEAHAIGLVDVLTTPARLRDDAMALAAEIAQSSPIAVSATRATLRRGLADAIAAITDHELAQQQQHFETEDFKEGVKAMAERRLPDFKGR